MKFCIALVLALSLSSPAFAGCPGGACRETPALVARKAAATSRGVARKVLSVPVKVVKRIIP